MPGSDVLRATYSSVVSNTTVEGVIYSVQLDDTVVDCRCASTHGLASNGISLRMLPHGPVQEYWLVGLVWCQVADKCLSTWFYPIGLALQLGGKCMDSAQ